MRWKWEHVLSFSSPLHSFICRIGSRFQITGKVGYYSGRFSGVKIKKLYCGHGMLQPVTKIVNSVMHGTFAVRNYQATSTVKHAVYYTVVEYRRTLMIKIDNVGLWFRQLQRKLKIPSIHQW